MNMASDNGEIISISNGTDTYTIGMNEVTGIVCYLENGRCSKVPYLLVTKGRSVTHKRLYAIGYDISYAGMRTPPEGDR